MFAFFSANDVSDISRAAFQRSPFPPRDLQLVYDSHVVARRRGRAIHSGWLHDVGLLEGLSDIREKAAGATHLELAIGTARHKLKPEDWPGAMRNRNRGRLGLEFSIGARRYAVYPTNSIATNRSLRTEFERYLTALSISEDEFKRRDGEIHLLNFRTFIVELSGAYLCTELFRGNIVIPPETFTVQDVDRLLLGMCAWFRANQDVDGRLTYKYWPSRGNVSSADNTIRQFMATTALFRLATVFPECGLTDRAAANLHFNLTKFYREENGLGLIDWDGSVKLGAVALAGVAILHQPNGDQHPGVLEKLTRTIQTLRNRDGSFKTFWKPEHRNDNQNFYPGEALLFLALLFGKTRFDTLLVEIKQSLHWYQNFFRASRNPAFVPWHTQACYVIRESTNSRHFDDYIFEMNDWLLEMQQWGSPIDPDLWGRFYHPSRPDYGPPHASSTGVYLESLSDALAVALSIGDLKRVRKYNAAIQKGIRSLAQLQFREGPELFYIAKADRVVGGLRTECYNNEIRVDNVQHASMALLKYRSLLNTFSSLSPS